ncbi:MAG: CocE/NonD family hydrolase, partial [Actinobacteria bacterium]|nr:CocE/NonD family hydrolase [Actinomycetota bacterium]NIU19929.1 CocE/NonD family hydrolase [Actinomycetota bacterium]NIU67424.1 CocE/NonD family hydrolase [Actinomycetota bacterium]NIV56397.1 CocE/NonD family hydrolase [Actinomycetota bacterium]NIV87896.1 CocE/NonD family hydrolase [Actinomycetota bacterium]
WQRRNIIPHMNGVQAAVMTVAGWFDAEDPYGPIEIYESIEARNPGTPNTLVVGPWFHGGWVRSEGDHLGNVSFETRTSRYYQEKVDLPFFQYYLKDEGRFDPPEVLAFASGSNAWHELDAWPPAGAREVDFYLRGDGRLAFDPPTATESQAADSYLSDPMNPVPYTREITIERTREYMVEDQRFADRRPDVLSYRTDVLTEDVTLAGPVAVDLYVSTTGTDADVVVKVIDVYPSDASEPEEKYMDVPMGGYQMLVRAEIMRGKS